VHSFNTFGYSGLKLRIGCVRCVRATSYGLATRNNEAQKIMCSTLKSKKSFVKICYVIQQAFGDEAVSRIYNVRTTEVI